MIDVNFWETKRVFITGHTGFKGSWLSLWLHQMGAEIIGYALEPPTEPSLFRLANLAELVDSKTNDIRDAAALNKALSEAAPDIVIHMAAQPLVRESYNSPVETYATNVMGTVNLLEAARKCPSVRAVINVTTDKCYENKEWLWGYRENEPMGGYDPYSSSKACSELVTAAYRQSFFNPQSHDKHGVAVATARAGNVIGGGDWATDRLICDCVGALLGGKEIVIRNPRAIRPWQHVLEPLSGYLILAQQLFEKGPAFGGAWNFGPNDSDARSVEWIVENMCKLWGNGASFRVDQGDHPHEATYLKLDCSKAKTFLGWQPRWHLAQTLDSIIAWTRAYKSGAAMRTICLEQVAEYQRLIGEVKQRRKNSAT
jgi:CDP-glucose 4,6-dehydratase